MNYTLQFRKVLFRTEEENVTKEATSEEDVKSHNKK